MLNSKCAGACGAAGAAGAGAAGAAKPLPPGFRPGVPAWESMAVLCSMAFNANSMQIQMQIQIQCKFKCKFKSLMLNSKS